MLHGSGHAGLRHFFLYIIQTGYMEFGLPGFHAPSLLRIACKPNLSCSILHKMENDSMPLALIVASGLEGSDHHFRGKRSECDSFAASFIVPSPDENEGP
jgi:hypothetical protein